MGYAKQLLLYGRVMLAAWIRLFVGPTRNSGNFHGVAAGDFDTYFREYARIIKECNLLTMPAMQNRPRRDAVDHEFTF